MKRKTGCDYYIIKQIRIENSDGTDTIELDRERCYFYGDQCVSNQQVRNPEEKYQHYLKVTFVGRVLYEDNEWKSDQIGEKYFDMVYENNMRTIV